MPSPNYSSRGGATVRLIVVHTAEGATTIESLGNYFAGTSAGVSSHTGADDKPNTVGEYVGRGWKAWTASNANSVAVQIELCAFAAWSTDEWHQHPNMLANCAAWIAEEAAAFGIPIVGLSASDAQGGGRGVCQHNDLGSWGGGHWDCGPGFPMGEVLAMAQGGPPAQQSAPGAGEDSTMAIVTAPGRLDLFVIGTDGGVYQAHAPAGNGAADLGAIAAADWMRLGGPAVQGKAISAAWTPDYRVLWLTVHGTDNHPYMAFWDNAAGYWSDFAPNLDGTMNPDPYGTGPRT
jgi:hypothetical protein